MLFILLFTLSFAFTFDDWIRKYQYNKMNIEFELRKSIFEETTKKIKQLQNKGYLSISNDSPFSVFTEEEIDKMINSETFSLPQLRQKRLKTNKKTIQLINEFDWRNSGIITPIKSSGTRYFEATIDGIESAILLEKKGMYTNETLKLSVQQLVDCQDEFFGKKLGRTNPCFIYLQRFGFMKEEDYPETSEKGVCQYNSSRVFGKVNKRRYLSVFNDEELIEMIKQTPIIVNIDMPSTMPYYDGEGIFENVEECSQSLPRIGLLLIGYGKTINGVPYWILKNCWGPSWGSNGYLYLKRNKNVCGIYSYGTYIESITLY
ncbi:cathepsin H precursor, putative [Entamoeba dispar SAW760]|uniref:Cathepsin H, putative n=1 Tax=Entamoeba dispar (strain ATCC PRA-260 / SAW760) TaxID=370354 RepID=B0EQC1_ENTDS|nr:cathepsin H precursor, putative [Entamoeba dispar SAW760]EDR23276.1 cathepsin H precursor, putative [Entamoeba dispar SAW760]|eukprot:EDR23276.1 cathepsin H precursor, putative [Entamoeba dispar SAW760]